ncbi:MAG: hypothetical protein HDR71_02615 [Lachnospiraceae bacterium]|nr:hypothetical protein [Lachnospiraceae bacterium]
MKAKEWIPSNDKTDDMKIQEEKIPFFATKRGRGISALIMVAVITVVLALSLSENSGAVTYQINDEMLGITCLDKPPLFIYYEDILQIELVDSLDLGEAIDIADWDSGWCGTYKNDDYGVYTLFAYSSCSQFIVVHYSDGVLVFNFKKDKSTEKACENLMEHCGLQAK